MRRPLRTTLWSSAITILVGPSGPPSDSAFTSRQPSPVAPQVDRFSGQVRWFGALAPSRLARSFACDIAMELTVRGSEAPFIRVSRGSVSVVCTDAQGANRVRRCRSSICSRARWPPVSAKQRTLWSPRWEQSQKMSEPAEPRVLERAGFDALLHALQARGYRLIGPTIRDRAIVYDTLRVERRPPGRLDGPAGRRHVPARATRRRGPVRVRRRRRSRGSATCGRRTCASGR